MLHISQKYLKNLLTGLPRETLAVFIDLPLPLTGKHHLSPNTHTHCPSLPPSLPHSPWDIKECLFPQCVLSQVTFPDYAKKWIDVRKLFGSFYRIRSGNLASMLEKLALKFEGREHCGLHDSENIARVLKQLICDGCVLKYNRFMPEDVVMQFDKIKRP